MFPSDHGPQTSPVATANPHRSVPRAARACHDSSAFCAPRSTAPAWLLRGRRPGTADRAPQRCLIAEARTA